MNLSTHEYTFGYTQQELVYVLLSVAADLILFSANLLLEVRWNTAHLSGFLAGAILLYLLYYFRPLEEESDERVRFPLWEFGILQLLALFLRGGVLAALVDSAGLSPFAAMIPTIATSIAIVLAGGRLWLFQKEQDQVFVWNKTLAIAIIVYAIGLRLVYSWTFELLHEEAYYWNYGMHLDIGYLDHPPMVGWLIWFFTSLFGHTEFAVRLSSLLCWLVAAYYVYTLTKRLYGEAAAFRAFVLASILPLFFGTALVITPDAPLVACWAGALYYLYRAVVEERHWSWIGVGVFMGLGLLSKYTIALLGLALVVFLLFDRRSRKWFLRPEPYLGLVICLALFSPVIIWNLQQNWASFGFQSTGRLAGDFDFALPELLGSALLLMTPTGLLAVVTAVVSKKWIHPEPVQAKREKASRFLLTTCLLPFGIFFFLSLFRLSKLNWTAPIWLGALPMIAFFMVKRPANAAPASWRARLPLKIASAWRATLIAMLCVYGIILHYCILGFPGVPYHKELLGIGIPDFVAQVAAIEEEYERQHGRKPFITCMDSDRLAGWIAFYRTKMAGSEGKEKVKDFIRNATGGHLYEVDSHMYRFWHPIETYDRERPLLIVTASQRDLQKDQVWAHVGPLSEMGKFMAYKHGKPTTPFYYQFAKMH